MQLIFGPDAGAPRRVDESELIELYRLPAPEGRGWLRTNFVMSLDGSVQGPDGRSGTINTASDHHVFALQRALADAVLVGANTVRSEGYRAIDLEPWQLEIREQEALAPYPRLSDHLRECRPRSRDRHARRGDRRECHDHHHLGQVTRRS